MQKPGTAAALNDGGLVKRNVQKSGRGALMVRFHRHRQGVMYFLLNYGRINVDLKANRP